MIDLNHFQNKNTQFFLGNNSLSNYKLWVKPKNCTWIYIFCIGPGGGGGGGFSAAVGLTKGGGGGGGSGAISSLFIPACLIPDRLYVTCGIGGTGGNAGSNGTTSTVPSAVYVYPANVNVNLLVFSNPGSLGTTGTSSAGGSGGAGGAASTSSNNRISSFGIFSSLVGQAGTAGVIAGTVTSQGFEDYIILGGCGGGGYTSAGTPTDGGSVSFGGNFPDSPGGTAGGVSAQSGNDGFMPLPYFYGYSGTGGGSTNDALSTGGNGGNGIVPGVGGGGGGGGITGGRGGNGGPGLVVIQAW